MTGLFGALVILKRFHPELSSCGLVEDCPTLGMAKWLSAAAAQAAIALGPFELLSPDQFEEAFAKFARERADALLVQPRRHLRHSSAAHRRARAGRAATYDIFHPPIHRGWRPDELRPRQVE